MEQTKKESVLVNDSKINKITHEACGCKNEHTHGAHEACDGENDFESFGEISCGCGHDHGDEDNHHEGHDHGSEENHSGIMLARLLVAGMLLIVNITMNLTDSISLALSILTYIVIGYDIVLRAIKNLFKGNVMDENFLMSIASIGAIIIGSHVEGAEVMLFYQTGEFFQSLAINNSRKQIKSLLKIKPEYANLKTAEGSQRVSPDAVAIGDVLIVKAGEKIPLDGRVIKGFTMVDTSALTGESMPVDVLEGADVLSGSINLTGVIEIVATKKYKDSTVSKILYMVESASTKKAVTENFITKFAKIYTPIVVGLAVVIGIFPSLFINGVITSEWIYKALVFLVVSCPCALVLSVPLTYFGGLGCASKHGILVKGGNYLEALANAQIAVFDKTGTLTKGKFTLEEIHCYGDITKAELLEIAAYGEHYSNHPIAVSVTGAFDKEIDESKIQEYIEIAGRGIAMKFADKNVLLGNLKLMTEKEITLENSTVAAGTVLFVAVEGVHVGTIVIADEVKENAKAAIGKIKGQGILKTVMLTGDNKAVGESVKSKIGIDEAYCQLLPQDKVAVLEELMKSKTTHGKVLFVGDGINDAPVLMRADVGIAMGAAGSDAAIESADVVIMNDDIMKIADGVIIAKKTKAIVWQNIVFAIGTKVLVMLLSVTVGIPMSIAIFADVGVALLAVLNATRVLMFRVRN